MKKNITTVAIIIAIGIGISLRARDKEDHPKTAHSVVILYTQVNEVTNNIMGDPCNGMGFAGSIVYASSSSSNAPQFPQQFHYTTNCPTPMGQPEQSAQAIANLLNAGYHIEHIEGNGNFGAYTLVH